MPRVYGVSPCDWTSNGTEYHTTKAAALKLARSLAAEGNSVTVTLYEAEPSHSADLVCRMLNHERWAVKIEVVAEVPARVSAPLDR